MELHLNILVNEEDSKRVVGQVLKKKKKINGGQQPLK